jgi:HD-GYP domain-containing protein (c-di-GMP phosphodiesterase class II)
MARRARRSRADNRKWDQMVAALRQINFVVNNIKLYPPTHTEVVGAIQKLLETLGPVFEEQDDVGFGFMDELLYIEGAMSIEETANNQVLVDRFARCRVKYLTLIKGVALDDLTKLFVILNAEALKTSEEHPAEQLSKAGVTTIHIIEAEVDDLAGKSKASRRRTLFDWYQRAVETLGAAQLQIRDDPEADLKPLYRVIDDMMATIRNKGHEPFLLLPALAGGLDPHLCHSVNVGALCCAIGDLHGLNSGQIESLCAAAFLHDIGRLTIPPEWTQDRSPLLPAEQETARQHCDWGFLLLLRQKALPPEMAVLAARHHADSQAGAPPDVFQRILALADAYDLARLSDRYYWRRHRQDRFLAHLLRAPKDAREAALVKLLVSVVGLYPVGSFVELDDGRRGLVVRPGLGAVDRPKVWLYEEPDVPVAEGAPADEDPAPALADLAELDEAGLRFKGAVRRAVAAPVGADLAALVERKKEFLLSFTL